MLPKVDKKPLFSPIQKKKKSPKNTKELKTFIDFIVRSDSDENERVFVVIELINHKHIFEWFRKETNYEIIYEYVDFMLQKGTEKINFLNRSYFLFSGGKKVDPNGVIETKTGKIKLYMKLK